MNLTKGMPRFKKHIDGKRKPPKKYKKALHKEVLFGATDPIRTDDLLITSELLYLLSHGSI